MATETRIPVAEHHRRIFCPIAPWKSRSWQHPDPITITHTVTYMWQVAELDDNTSVAWYVSFLTWASDLIYCQVSLSKMSTKAVNFELGHAETPINTEMDYSLPPQCLWQEQSFQPWLHILITQSFLKKPITEPHYIVGDEIRRPGKGYLQYWKAEERYILEKNGPT